MNKRNSRVDRGEWNLVTSISDEVGIDDISVLDFDVFVNLSQ